MKDREIACKYYEYEGSCLKNRKGTFNKSCQHCNLYEPVDHGRPRRINLKNKKIRDAENKDYDY